MENMNSRRENHTALLRKKEKKERDGERKEEW